ncbi:hypothetical protein ACFYON_06455 [Micromonospora sp. NPDC005686]|uniref:hypothetical protein n=1 Tax=unclassified Micromonospora TaxID=2617518 RepID=UPI0033AE566B
MWHDRGTSTLSEILSTGAIMSGRRLGRLLGSLLVLAALMGGGVGGVDFDGINGGLQTLDIIWQ